MARHDAAESEAESVSFDSFQGRILGALALRGDATPEVIRVLLGAVPADNRRAVLSRIDAALATTEPHFVLESFPGLAEDDPGCEIAADAEAFVQRLESGHYFQGLAWDDDRQQQRAFGDESWAREMDDFLARAATVAFNGNTVLAAHLYARLLGAFRHEHHVGIFCGPDRAQAMVETDLAEAKRNYLRALYDVVPPEARPKRLLAELIQLRDIGDAEVGVLDLSTSASDPDGPPLAGFSEFVEGFIGWLESVEREPGPVSREIRRHLREAVLLARGADGLGTLARREGGGHPEAWHDWFGALLRAGRIEDALAAGQDGIPVIEDVVYRARLADRTSALAARHGRADLALELARVSWRTRPSEPRLIQYAAAAEAAGVRARVFEREAGDVLHPAWAHGDAMAARVLLLAGRVEDAIGRFQRADAMGWGRADHAGTVVLPFLLTAASGLSVAPSGSALARLWDDLDAPARGYFDRRLLLDRVAAVDETAELDARGRPYSELLLGTLAAMPVGDAHRVRWLSIAQAKVEGAVRDLLASQHRRGQALAATLVIALAETQSVVRGTDVADSFLRTVRRPHAKESAFRQALETLRAQSPILMPGRLKSL